MVFIGTDNGTSSRSSLPFLPKSFSWWIYWSRYLLYFLRIFDHGSSDWWVCPSSKNWSQGLPSTTLLPDCSSFGLYGLARHAFYLLGQTRLYCWDWDTDCGRLWLCDQLLWDVKWRKLRKSVHSPSFHSHLEFGSWSSLLRTLGSFGLVFG